MRLRVLFSALLVLGCARELPAPPAEQAASKSVSPLARWNIAPGARTRFVRRDDSLAAEVTNPFAHVTLGTHANQGFTLRDRSGIEARVVLRGARAAFATIAEDSVVYPDALGRGRDVVHRVSALGTEDFVVVDAQRSSLVYEIVLGEQVAGLRLVERTIELLDRDGTPRLRMAPPYLVGRDGAHVEASVAIEGCAYDASPRAPWGRAPVAPGSRTCAVRIGWGDVATPALLDPAWTATGAMASKRSAYGAVALSSSKALLVGGTNGPSTLATAELWDAASGTFATTGSMGTPRTEMTPFMLSTGKVLVAGGSTTTGGSIIGLSTAELYETASGTFATTGSMAKQRRSYAIAPVAWTTPSGKPVVFGGVSGSTAAPAFETHSSAEAYDPAGGTFLTLGGAMTVPRRGFTATALTSGAVLLAGGNTTAAEIHTTSGGFVATAGPMTSSRVFASAVRLADGRVLVAGGVTVSSLSTTELFNPSANTFSAGPTMTAPRTGTTLILPSGHLIVAGDGATADVLPSPSGAFVATGTTTVRRSTASVLVGSKLLVAGGMDDLGNTLSTADVFVQLANGAACGGSGDCTSGFCVDGVCCDKACAGACEACSATKKGGSGSDGVCGPIANGNDPDKECTQQICVSGTQTNAFVCNGAGACRSNGTVACSPYTCDATGKACLTACTGDSTCVGTHWCNGSTCVPKGANGASCTANRECTSSQCWDSVCCDKACGGSCEACSGAKKGSGVDGVCAPVAAGSDPKSACAPDPGYPTSCKADGFCDGAGACRTYAIKGTACGATKCEAGKVSGLTCDTGGNCLSGTTVECEPYACGATACKTTCANDGDCTANAFCTSVSTCAPKKANGQACTAGKECTSANCVDGVCCNGTCLQQCEACNQLGSEGTCVPIKGAPRTARPACKGDPALCGGACDGIKANECAYAPATTECGSKCSAGIEVKSLCDGAGTCAVGTPRTCGAYGCDADKACKTSCTGNGDCGDKYGCVDGKCVPAQSRCSDDESKSIGFDGKETACGSYRCDPALGACRKECTATTECTPGMVCNVGTRQCEPPTSAADESDGGCAYGGRSSGSLFIVFLAFALGAARRRQSVP